MTIFSDLPGNIRFLKKSLRYDEGLTLFSIMRDEHYFIPHFLDHYRALGVNNFVIYADRCDIYFLAELEAQNDVSILVSDTLKFGDKFGQVNSSYSKRLGTLLRETFSNKVMRGRWHVVVDADEFLLVPPPFRTIPQYTDFLEDLGRDYSFASMVDFYPRRLSERNFGYGTSPFAGAPFFDRGPSHRRVPETQQMLYTKKGLRWRLLRLLWERHRQELVDMGLNLYKIQYQRIDFKHPVVRTSETIERVGSHEISLPSDTTHASVLCHFKFYPQHDDKIAVARKERQYNANSREYELMDLMIRKFGSLDLVFPNSLKFRDVSDLVVGGFLKPAA